MGQAGFAALVAAVLGGAAAALQGPVNAALARVLGHQLLATFVSFAVGLLALGAAALVTTGLAPLARLGGAAPWQLLGGLLGAYYVWSMIFGVSQLGVVTTVAAVIFGQMAVALAVDATGALGLAANPVTPTRLLAVALVAGGVVLSRL